MTEELIKKYPHIEHVVYTPSPKNAVHKAFSDKAFVEYDLSNVDYILGIHSDFLGTGESSVHFSKQYAKRKDEQSLETKIEK